MKESCWFFHKWGKWEDYVIDAASDEKLNGQKRHCKRCNKKQIRSVNFYDYNKK